jgi:hypothetical protein
VVKIRYARIPESLHVEVRSERGKAIIYLAPGLSRAQRQAALRKARQSGRVRHSPPLPASRLLVAVCADRAKTISMAAAAAARAHPVGFAVPAVTVVAALALYALLTSVDVRHARLPHLAALPGQARPLGTGAPPTVRLPMRPAAAATIGVTGVTTGQQPLPRLTPPVPPRPAAGTPAPGSPPGQVTGATPSPSSAPGLPGGGLCVQLGNALICMHLPPALLGI